MSTRTETKQPRTTRSGRHLVRGAKESGSMEKGPENGDGERTWSVKKVILDMDVCVLRMLPCTVDYGQDGVADQINRGKLVHREV